MRLALFDLDQTLLSGDSDVLWCDFLIDCGLLNNDFRERNADMGRRYATGAVPPAEFCSFFASTLAGRDLAFWKPWRERFLHEVIKLRIPDDARALVQRHREAGDTLVLTTATNRLITELTAIELDVEHLIATELEMRDGRFTGRTQGVVNMCAGKVERLRQWLAELGHSTALLPEASFYSDSINDLPLLRNVGRPVVVDPDSRLLSTALREGWPVLRFQRR